MNVEKEEQMVYGSVSWCLLEGLTSGAGPYMRTLVLPREIRCVGTSGGPKSFEVVGKVRTFLAWQDALDAIGHYSSCLETICVSNPSGLQPPRRRGEAEEEYANQKGGYAGRWHHNVDRQRLPKFTFKAPIGLSFDLRSLGPGDSAHRSRLT